MRYAEITARAFVLAMGLLAFAATAYALTQVVTEPMQ